MNKLSLAAMAAAIALTPMAANAQRATNALIVVADMDRIYATCTACVAAANQIQGQITAMQQRRQVLSAPLQTEMQSIQTAATAARNLQGPARATAEQAIQTRLTALQQREQTANQELGRSEQVIRSTQAHVSQQLNNGLTPIFRQVMTARGANIVLPKGATLDSSDALDVTADVLAALNQALPGVSVTPMPQQAAPAATPTTTSPTQPRPQGR